LELLNKYFGNLDGAALEKLQGLKTIYEHWNRQINLISRKDFDNFQINHLLHSLSIGKIIQFESNSRILDVGTGGGFPGIPLAIVFPNVQFLLVDSIGKKIKVVREVAAELGLKNVKTFNGRVESVNEKFDFIVSRAVTTLPKFEEWVFGKILERSNNQIPNGILYLKGGDISQELAAIKMKHNVFELSDFFDEPFFETKKLVHLYG
jgi:16S rRNA (guanine527-N7)-methyltransferase